MELFIYTKNRRQALHTLFRNNIMILWWWTFVYILYKKQNYGYGSIFFSGLLFCFNFYWLARNYSTPSQAWFRPRRKWKILIFFSVYNINCVARRHYRGAMCLFVAHHTSSKCACRICTFTQCPPILPITDKLFMLATTVVTGTESLCMYL